jgi:hypothetical protein
MDIVNKRRVKDANGNAAAEYSDIISRACSWQRGADCAWQDIDAESQEEDKAFGVPNNTVPVHERASEHTKRGGRTDGVE